MSAKPGPIVDKPPPLTKHSSSAALEKVHVTTAIYQGREVREASRCARLREVFSSCITCFSSLNLCRSCNRVGVYEEEPDEDQERSGAATAAVTSPAYGDVAVSAAAASSSAASEGDWLAAAVSSRLSSMSISHADEAHSMFDASINPPRTRDEVRILYIEGNAVNQKIFQRACNKMGFSVSKDAVGAGATSPEHAVNGNLTLIGDGNYATEVLSDRQFLKQFHLIMFDFQLERSSGPAVFRHINEVRGAADSWMPVCLSFSTGADSVDQAKAMGMDGGVIKPCSSDRLSACIDHHLSIKYPTYGSPTV